ncbi:MAG: sulfite exporter TauE/SafE family protein [Candidatus Pacebacteria bacterium]|nr:sulfite exporter TauE/SafE family protein [Candidatus Paceibacterota bacterium]MCF7857140.1 sulfite exporter TauE/SafE family protein [Candidatus Paceibacterota bacterium]
MEIFVYILLGLSSFFFVIVPMSGAVALNPLLSLVVEPHVAVGMAAFFFMVNSFVKMCVFHNDILFVYIRKMLPITVVMAILGSYTISLIQPRVLFVLIFLMSLYFLIKKIYEMLVVQKKPKDIHGPTIVFVSIISGFMQGTGLGAGGSLRKVYLLSENMSLQQVHGTTSLISFIALIFAFLVRLKTDQLSIEMVVPILYLIPLIIISIVFGKKILKRLSKGVADILGLVTMILITVLLFIKLF